MQSNPRRAPQERGLADSLAWALAALALALAVVWASPAPGAEEAAAEPDEPTIPVVVALKWEGLRVLGKSDLRKVTFTEAPTWKFWRPDPQFSEPTLVGDMTHIRTLYRLHGYYEADASYRLEWNDAGTKVKITIQVVEGEPVLLEQLEITVPPDVDMDAARREALDEGLPLVEQRIFSPRRYAEARDTLLNRMADAGFPQATIQGGAEVDVARRSARVQWKVTPGPVTYFGEVRFEGLSTVRRSTAEKEIRITPGERYRTAPLAETRRDLQGQGLYRWVTVRSPQPGKDDRKPSSEPAPTDLAAEDGVEAEPPASPNVWPVIVTVTERPPHTFDAGVGYGSEESFRATVGWRHANFLGNARKLRISALYSLILSKGEIEFTQPYFFEPKLSLIVKAALRHETEPAYTVDRVLSSIGLTRRIVGPWQGRITYRYSYQDVVRTSSAVDLILEEEEGVSKVATFEFGVRRTTLDDLLSPTRGTWLDLSVGPSLEEIGSDFNYITLLAEARGFLPLGRYTVLGGRIRIGAIQPLPGTAADGIPVVSRFFAGGSNSFRGVGYHRLVPAGATTDTVGGTSMLEASVEWRFPIWKKLGGVLFFDAAQLDLTPYRYDPRDLLFATGPGIRYDTIVGPLRFDFGVLLNPPSDGPERYRWYLSVGHSF